MKGLAAFALAGAIVAAGGFWFLSNPVVVKSEVKPLKPSANIPTFKPLKTALERQN